MRKTILTLGAALIALSAVQAASATEHRTHKAHRAAVATEDQFRNSNAAWPAAVQPEWPGYGYGDGYYSRGFSAPAGR